MHELIVCMWCVCVHQFIHTTYLSIYLFNCQCREDRACLQADCLWVRHVSYLPSYITYNVLLFDEYDHIYIYIKSLHIYLSI